MKLANLCWMNTEFNNGKKAVNFGDILQFKVFDEIFENNFPHEDILKISVSEMKNYTGETLVVPMNWSLFDPNYMENQFINISPDIIPIFIAMTVESGTFQDSYINEYNINYLKMHEPIGCRDEKTKNILCKNGVKAYLNGCMTSTLSKRDISGNKILLVDVPIEVEKFLPNWSEEVETYTQQQYFDEDCSIGEIRQIIDERYDYYFNEAKMIITSRLHVASPCMAVGIPVILVKNTVDARFSWLNTYIPLYSKENYSQIDWNPMPISYEDNKRIIIQNAVNRISNVLYKEKNEDYSEVIDALYEKNALSFPSFKSTIHNNFDKITEFIENKYNSDYELDYAIWGLGQGAENLYEYISSKYKNFRMTAAIDMYKTGMFHGKEIISPYQYVKNNKEVVFVVSVQASNMAEDLLKHSGFSAGEFVCAGDVFIKKRR